MKLASVLLPIAILVALASPRAEAPSAALQSQSAPSPLIKLRGLVSLCQRSDTTSTAGCGGYITGFIAGSLVTQNAAVIHAVAEQVVTGKVPPTDDALDRAATKLREQSKLFCIRSAFTAGYVQAVVAQYGREHSELLDEAAGDEMLKILAKAFPCSKPK